MHLTRSHRHHLCQNGGFPGTVRTGIGLPNGMFPGAEWSVNQSCTTELHHLTISISYSPWSAVKPQKGQSIILASAIKFNPFSYYVPAVSRRWLFESIHSDCSSDALPRKVKSTGRLRSRLGGNMLPMSAGLFLIANFRQHATVKKYPSEGMSNSTLKINS
jgi:hypothetical protein